MKKTIAFYFALAVCLLLAGCGWKHSMVGPNGDVKVCYASGAEVIGVGKASYESEDCMEYYRARGYKEDESQRYWYQHPDAYNKSNRESGVDQRTQKESVPVRESAWVFAGKNIKEDVDLYYYRSSIVRGDGNKASVLVKMVPAEGSTLYKNIQTKIRESKGQNIKYSYSIFDMQVNCGNDMFRIYNEKSYSNDNIVIGQQSPSDWQHFRKSSVFYPMIKETLCNK